MRDLVRAADRKSCRDVQHRSLYLGIDEGFSAEASPRSRPSGSDGNVVPRSLVARPLHDAEAPAFCLALNHRSDFLRSSFFQTLKNFARLPGNLLLGLEEIVDLSGEFGIVRLTGQEIAEVRWSRRSRPGARRGRLEAGW